MVAPRPDAADAHGLRGLEHLVRIAGDDDLVERTGGPGIESDALNEGLVAKEAERLAGEPLGAEAGGYDPEDPIGGPGSGGPKQDSRQQTNGSLRGLSKATV